MTTARRKRRSAYGCDDFTARLAAREAALGLAQQPSTNVLAVTQDNFATTQHTAPDAAPPESPMGDMGHDAWGNAYLSKPGLLGQYTIRSQWHRDGRTVYVCGSPAAHARAGHWRFDGRIATGQGQGYVCALCFPTAASW